MPSHEAIELQLLPPVCTFLALYGDANTSRSSIVPMLIQPYTLQDSINTGFQEPSQADNSTLSQKQHLKQRFWTNFWLSVIKKSTPLTDLQSRNFTHSIKQCPWYAQDSVSYDTAKYDLRTEELDSTCQIPSLKRPAVIGMVKELPIIEAFTCAEHIRRRIYVSLSLG